MAEKMSIDNKTKDESDESVGSTPEGDTTMSAPAGSGAGHDGQQPKRKGGRKPIYATSEERKQRNRQAQAAFRERRTEYIKQLEETIRVHESNLHSLQAAHRNAADECLMLRYKNSLLERILLEKGIDVQAELRAKTGSPNLGPTHMPQNLVHPPPIQRAIMNRHSRRSTTNMPPKNEPVSILPPPLHAPLAATSPKNNRPTPSSHSNSPSNTASGFSPAASDNASLRGSSNNMHRQPATHMAAPAQPARSQPPMHPNHNMRGGPVATSASYYPTPAFQNHIEQLEQEYDAQADMVDDQELDTQSGPGPYPSNFGNDCNQPMMLSPASTGPGHHVSQVPDQLQHSQQTPNQQYPSMTQLLDQNLDWDPFGLSASMAFPAQ
jgi:hypothetical protein